MMDVKELFEQGGPLMWAILASSIIGVAVFIERLWSLRRSNTLPRAFVHRIRTLVVKGKRSDALLLCQENRSSIALIMAAGLRGQAQGRSREQLKESVEEVGNREVARMGRNVEIIGTVAAVSPLLGLLGTVLGMIQVFQQFVEKFKSGQVGPDAFAEGIWQALITTAYGLVVAIPMLVIYKYLTGRTDRIVVDMEEDALNMVDLLADSSLVEAAATNGREGT